MSNILITGAAGLFGTHLSRYFTSSGHKVYGLDNLSGGYKSNIDPKTEFFKMDLLDSEKLKSLFEKNKIEYVIHTAAMAAVCLSPFIRSFNYSNNLVAYSNLINCCINYDIKKFIHLSSMDVYGKNQVPFKEEFVPNPEDPYGISKYAIELDLKNAYLQFGLNYNIVRPHNVAGIYQNIWDMYRNVLGIWIRKILNKELITVYGDGRQKRAFSDISFYMKPIEKLLFEDITDEIYNIGADNPISIIDAAIITQKIGRKFGYDSNIIFLEGRDEVKEAFPDHSKAKRDLNFSDETNLEKLIEDMFIWASKEKPKQVKKINYEIEKGIYSYWR